MKKLLSMGLLTLCALTVSQQQAQAWVNAKFSVGLNWQLQSGNNNWLWGAWKNGQVPGPEAFGQGPGPGPSPSMYAPGGLSIPPASSFPYFGSQPSPQPMPTAQSYFPAQTPPPALAQNANAYNYGAPYYNPYQTVSYQNPGYYYPTYYSAYPQAQYYGQVPYYWYNNR